MTIKHLGYTIVVEPDSCPMNPREEYDHESTMALLHRKYKLGDKHTHDIDDLKAIESSDLYYSLPVFLYDHSGITISTAPFSCSWDSGKVGIIYISKSLASKVFPDEMPGTPELREKVLNMLKAEVEEYDHYLTGDVYSYTVFYPCKECGHPQLVESIGGYYGEKECIAEALAFVEDYIKSETEKLLNKPPVEVLPGESL